MKIDELIKNNYKHLLQVAKRIAKSEAEDLLSSTYLLIFDKKNFELPSNNDEAVHYFIMCLNNNFKLYNSNFNKQKRGSEIIQGEDFFSNLTDAEDSEINERSISEFKDTLPEHERILFELHYEDEISLLSISEEFKKIGIDRDILRRYHKPLKEKIKTKWKQ